MLDEKDTSGNCLLFAIGLFVFGAVISAIGFVCFGKRYMDAFTSEDGGLELLRMSSFLIVVAACIYVYKNYFQKRNKE